MLIKSNNIIVVLTKIETTLQVLEMASTLRIHAVVDLSSGSENPPPSIFFLLQKMDDRERSLSASPSALI